MRFLTHQTHFDFLAKRQYAMIFSGLLIVISITSLAVRGLSFGIDFTGGTLVEVGFEKTANIGVVRKVLASGGYGDASVQNFGTDRDLLIRLAPRKDIKAADLSDKVFDLLKNDQTIQAGKVDKRRVEFVGPQVGKELTEDGGLAMIYALIGILIYVSVRFEYRFAIGSVAALVHDVTVTLGVFSVFQVEFDLTVMAAILAVIGYSLNDTIVVFDRIRENFRKMRKGTSEVIVNTSLNQTLSRTLMTSMTTMVVLLALFFIGGKIIHGFALALIVGVLIGTYSSIYVASIVIMAMGISKQDLMPVEKEGATVEDRP